MLNGTNDTNAKTQSKMVHASCYQQVRGRPPKGDRSCYTDGKVCFHCKQPIARDTKIGWFRDNENGVRHGKAPKTNGTPATPATTNDPAFPEDLDEDAPASETPATPALPQGLDAVLTALVETVAARVEARIAPKIERIARDASKVTRVHVHDHPIEGPPRVKDMGRQHPMFDRLVQCIAAGVSVWIVGPAGSGKTTGCHNAAIALDQPFFHTGAISDPYPLLGFMNAQGTYVRTPFREAYEHGGVFLWDDVDASDPAALCAFNAALANGACAFPDGMVIKHPMFRCVATANTYGLGATAEYVGRTRQDGAYLDRFASLEWDYDEAFEREICGNEAWARRVQGIRARARAKGLRVLVTPRASLMGAKLLAAGLDQDAVESMLLRRAMTPEQWESVR